MSTSPSLDLIAKGRQEQAPRILLYSPPKIGKTGWAAQIPGVVFVAAEQGTQEYDVARIPTIDKCVGKGGGHRCGWFQFKAWLDFFAHKEHPYQALAIDTLDWLEGVLFSHLIATDPKGKTTLVEAHGGYGKAYDIAVDEWRQVSGLLDAISLQRKMTIVLLAHSAVSKFYDPQSDSFDQHKLKMHKYGSGFWQEWADAILFANFEMTKDLITDSWKSTGKRIIHAAPNPSFAFVAGNRYGLPAEMDMTYAAFAQAMAASTPAALEQELETVLAKAPDTFTYGGESKTKDDVRRGFKAALDRRGMRLVIDIARAVCKTQPDTGKSNTP